MAFDAPSTAHRVISADFFTSSYRVVGKVMVPSGGMLGLANDASSSFLEILDARLARVHMPSKLVDHFEVVQVVKSQIFAISFAKRDDLGSLALSRGGYTRVTEFPLRITTPIYEMDGMLEWPSRFDATEILASGTQDFIPLFNTVLTAVLLPALRLETPAILFNRKQVDILALKNQRMDE